MGKQYQLADGCQNIRYCLVGSSGIVVCYEVPNLIEIRKGFRMEIISVMNAGNDAQCSLP